MKKLVCMRCGHKWQPRGEHEPLACPSCKSYRWDVPKVYGNVSG